MTRTPREIFFDALAAAKSHGFSDKQQAQIAMGRLAEDINTPGSACVILRAACRRLDDCSTVEQWARGEWD